MMVPVTTKNIVVRNLLRSNLFMAVAFSGILFIFLTEFIGFTTESLYGIISLFVNIQLIGLIHIYVRIKLDTPAWLSPLRRDGYQFVLISVFVIMFGFLAETVRQIFLQPEWTVQDFRQPILLIGGTTLFFNTIIFFMHSLIITSQQKLDVEVEVARLKLANAEAHNLLLKQQIHPHFLFNSLSIIKTLYRNRLDAGETYVMHLANFLRASLSSTMDGVVPIEEELALCDDYIAMQKARFGKALQYEVDIRNEDIRNAFLPSFSLQLLLENAIKHNKLTRAFPLRICLSVKKGYLVVENNLRVKKGAYPSTGNGLLNLMKRYQLISGDEIIIDETEKSFCVRLKILGHEHYNNRG